MLHFLQICSGTAIVAFTAAPYCTSKNTTTTANSADNRNAALVSILGESQYFKTNLMNIYAFHQSNVGVGRLSSGGDERIILRRTASKEVAPVELIGIPITRSSSTPSSGCYFPCS